MQSKEIRFFLDEFFAKPPHSDVKTIWHTDRMGWPVTGNMVPSLWMPLTPIVKANSLEVIRGSHTQDVKYWLFSPNARKMIKPEERPPHPQVERLRNDPDVEFLSWDLDPGDLLIVHPWPCTTPGETRPTTGASPYQCACSATTSAGGRARIA